MNPPNQPVSLLLKKQNDWIVSRTEQFASGRLWWLKVFILCVGFSILFSGGLDWGVIERGGCPESYVQKMEHPLLDLAKISPLNSHDANINFRLTVPVFFHLTGIHSRWGPPVLTVLAVCSILLTACFFVFQLTGDRVSACFLALNVAATYAGSFGFIEYYDAIALSQLALACLPKMPWWGRGLLVFTAAFTDERALVAGLLVLVGAFFFSGGAPTLLARLRNPDWLAVAGGMAAYLAVRLVLMKYAGLSSPTGGTGPGRLLINFDFLHPGIWYSLEGGWLFYALAVGVLFWHRQLLAGSALVLASLGFLVFAFMIGDLMRSTIYIFPLLFVCVKIVRQNESLPLFRTYCLLAFLISAVGGNYNVYLEKITWFQPLVVHWLHLAVQVLYDWIYPLLPHTMPHAVPAAS
jgi:hypothetical protein